MKVPDNLVPLPTQPWEVRPDAIPVAVEEARTAIWRTQGNIAEAAAILKVAPSRLRAMVKRSEYLLREVEEAREQIVDLAEGVVRDALSDPDRADAMARFVLQTQGKVRGWGNAVGGNSVNIKATGGITFQWADGTLTAQPEDDTVLEGEVVSE